MRHLRLIPEFGRRSVLQPLSSGGGPRGVLELNIEDGGWDAVCGSGFYEDAAKAFCRQLGYSCPGPGDCSRYHTTHGDDNFAAGYINCPSSATSISDCSSHERPYEAHCPDTDTVGLDCGGGTAPPPPPGGGGGMAPGAEPEAEPSGGTTPPPPPP